MFFLLFFFFFFWGGGLHNQNRVSLTDPQRGAMVSSTRRPILPAASEFAECRG